MSPANIIKALFVVFVLAAACLGAMWLAGAIFFGLAKVNPFGETDLWTWWTYWKAYKDDPAVSKRLLIAAGISALVVSGAIIAAIIGAMREVKTLYGEARFANPSEIAKAGLFGEKGIIIGRWRNRFLLFGGMQFVLLAAPTRSGKGVGIVIPNLLHWSDSVVVLDVKQENFMVTSGYRARHGQQCFLFNPFAKDGATHRYNPLGYVSDDPRHRVMELLAIATALYPGQGKDSFFDEAARNLFMGLGLMIFETEGLPRTIGEMLRQSSGKGLPVKDYLQGIIQARNYREHAEVVIEEAGDDDEAVIDALRDELGMDRLDAEVLLQDVPAALGAPLPKAKAEALAQALEAAGAVFSLVPKQVPLQVWDGQGDPPLSAECVDALNRFLGTSENTLSSIMASFNVPLTLWASPIFDAATSENDFDLRDVRKKRMSIYLGIPANKLAEAELILNLFFTQLINLNTDELLGARPELKYQCLLLMDEFAAPGRIAIIDKANAYIAGYGLRLLTIIQSPGQLEAEPRKGYGRESARTLITNHACQVLYTPREQRDANEYSEMLGTLTFRAKGRSRQLSGRSGTSESESDQKRPLMLPQELKELPQRKQIVNLENTKPILCEKIAYYEDEVFLDRLREVSPSLAKLGKRKPNRSQLETAWGAGELASRVPMIDLDLHQAKTQNRTREATAADVAAGVDLARIAVDVSAIAPLSGAGIAPEAVEAFVDDFFEQFARGAGAKPPSGDEDDDAPDHEDDGDIDGDDEPATTVVRLVDLQPHTAVVTAEPDPPAAPVAIAEPEGQEDQPQQVDLSGLYYDALDDAPDDYPGDIPDFVPDDDFDESAIFGSDQEDAPVLDLSVLDRPETPAGH